MKRLIFIVLVCNAIVFGASMQNLYKAYEKGYEFKNNDIFKIRSYCINQYNYSSDLEKYCTLGGIYSKNGLKKDTYSNFVNGYKK